MKHSMLFLMICLFLCSSCNIEKGNTDDLILQSFSASGCLNTKSDDDNNSYTTPPEEVVLTADGSSLIVKHNNIVFNCATSKDDISFTIAVEDNIIYLNEINASSSIANCLCRFNTSCELKNLQKGEYVMYISILDNGVSIARKYKSISFVFSSTLSKTFEPELEELI